MSQGGARARSGPPPERNALRRERDGADWRHLPTAGREGEAPAWPLARPTARERTLWAAEWRRPQAVAWQELGLALEVALYVRNVAAAERTSAGATTRRLVLSQMDSLGLTASGLARNRWVIDDAGGQASPDAPAEPVARASAKERALKLVVND